MVDEELSLGGSRRMRLPPKLLGVLVLLAALGAGVAVGYKVRGSDSGASSNPRATVTATLPATVVSTAAPSNVPASAEPAFEAVSDTDDRCSVQHGTSLQLGVELMNTSAQPFVISYVRVLLPLGGLRAAPVVPGVCGQLGSPSPTAGTQLDPGARLWLTTRLAVLTRCPAALPVQFEVHFVNGEQVTYGFADLGEVPYSGCN